MGAPEISGAFFIFTIPFNKYFIENKLDKFAEWQD